MPSSKNYWCIIPSWLALVALAFWWFEYRYWQHFAPATATFSGVQISQLYSRIGMQGKITVVHFSNKNCPCNTYSRDHVQRLQPQLSVSHQVTLNPSDNALLNISIPASPATAIWDSHGQLAYFGPYSSGAVCGSGLDFVSRTLDAISKNKNPQWVNMVGIGCYCTWKNTEVQNV